MKQIPLTQGKFALVDDEDYEYLMQWKWFACCRKHIWYYARRSICWHFSKTVLMHRIIMKAEKGQMIDHKDGNGLNNQKSNLRFCSISQNNANRKATGVSKYLGVSLRKALKRHKLKNGEIKEYRSIYWRANISMNGRKVGLGNFKTEEQAALAYNEAAKKQHGEFAKLNVIESNTK